MDRADIRKGDIIFIYTGYHKYSLDGETPDERRYMLRHLILQSISPTG